MDDIDLRVDLNGMDETGLPWAFVDEARDPAAVVAGRHLLVGGGSAVAVAVVVDVDGDIVLRPAAARPSLEVAPPPRPSCILTATRVIVGAHVR